jgi:hypothetical protein
MAGDVITLADFALTTKDEVLGPFVMNIVRESKIMADIPFVTKDVLSVVNKKWKTLPAGQTRNLSEGYSTVKGLTQDDTWEPRLYGGDIQIDKKLAKVSNAIESETSLQTKMFIAGMTRDWTYDFIANTPLVNAKGMWGLIYLAANYQNSRQQIFVDSSADNAGTGLDVTASAATRRKFLNNLDKAIKYAGLDSGRGKGAIYMNEALSLGLRATLTGSGLLDTTKDQFDRQFTTYAGVQIYDTGYKSDLSTEIIGVVEGTGAHSTSLYVVRWDRTDGCIGVQMGPMEVYDPLDGREMESLPAYLLRMDWGTMIIPRSDFCITRLGGILNPASWTEPV